MKKGIMYTMDAVYAIILIVTAFSLITFYFSGGTGTSIKFGEALNSSTTDAALIGFYRNSSAAALDINAALPDPDQNQEFHNCIITRTYDLNNDEHSILFGVIKQSQDINRFYCKWYTWKKE